MDDKQERPLGKVVALPEAPDAIELRHLRRRAASPATSAPPTPPPVP